MKVRTIIKIFILIITFFLCLAGFSYLTRVGNRDYRGTIEKASMPIVKVMYQDLTMGMLHGYVTQMDMSSMRGPLIPVPEDRSFRVIISTYGKTVDKAEYSIRELDGTGFIDNGVLTAENDDTTESYISGFRAANILSPGKQYSLLFTLTCGGDVYYYYTRLLENDDEYLPECLRFAWDFHNSTFDEEALADLSVYIEPDGTDTYDMSYTTIHSSLAQIGWAGKKPEVFGGCVVTLSEATPYFDVINIDYIMIMADEAGDIAYYNVDEYYRVRYGVDVNRCYLLSFERRVNEIFDGDTSRITAEGIKLGVNCEDNVIKRSGSGKTVSFAVQGDLWSFDMNSQTLTNVYSFRDFTEHDARENTVAHIIKPLRVEEDGNLIFAVYGYMNRGIHEGKVGIDIFVYDALTGMVTEQMFIPETVFEDVLMADIGDMIYVNASGKMFVHLSGNIIKIDLREKKYDYVSRSADIFYMDINKQAGKLVWQEEPKGELFVLDMETGKVKSFEKNNDDSTVTMLGFLDVDYVYGVSDKKVKYTDEGLLPISEVKIIGNEEGDVIKNYSKKKNYITEVVISDYSVDMKRAVYKDGEYVFTDTDSLVNEQGEALIYFDTEKRYDTDRKNLKYIVLEGAWEFSDIKSVTASLEILDKPPVSELEKGETDAYFIYEKGKCERVTRYVSDAVNFASEESGIVVKDNDIVWSRGKAAYYGPVEIDTAEIALLGQPSEELSGVDFSDALGFVSRGAVMIVETGKKKENADKNTGEKNELLITGYDSSNVWIGDIDNKISEKKPLQEVSVLAGKNGNKFRIYELVK